MPTFNAADVADQTATFTEALNDTAVVLRPPSGTADLAPGGGRYSTAGTVGWTAGTAVAARWARSIRQATERPIGGATWARGLTPIKLVAGTDVTERDKLVRGLDSSLWHVRSVDVRPYGVLVDAEAISS